MVAIPLLGKEQSIAPSHFNRWLVPPAALAIHLSIGQVYAFSVFKVPLTHLFGITHSTRGDWSQEQIAVIFSIAIAVLGISTALFGRWIERVGPRLAMFCSACCFGLGFLIAAAGVRWHQIWLLYFGYGVVGGVGLGLGYLTPVAVLVRWFPDRPGLATGLAIMGFGGGAMIGSPLALALMHHFGSPATVGVAPTMVAMGVIYFCFMQFGVLTVRLPAEGWRPEGWTPATKATGMITRGNVTAASAFRAPQFYLLWLVLCLNTTAGIGIIEQASPMIQDMFPSRVTAAAAGGFVGLLSLFNMGGRFFWSSTSDYVGRKTTFMAFFVLGAGLYALAPLTGASHWNSVLLFVAIAVVLLSMYGGGFSTLPAYVRDLFGSREFGPIYGRLLTAWSVAGIVGPMIVNHIRHSYVTQAHLGPGGPVPPAAYSTALWIMSGLLVVGLACNLLIRPVSERLFVRETTGGAGATPAGAGATRTEGQPLPGIVTPADLQTVRTDPDTSDLSDRAGRARTEL